MPSNTVSFTTGPSLLPDVGELSYNGCKFSPLFASKISGTHVKDAAGRTLKFMEYVLTVDGYVTLGGALKARADGSIDQTTGDISPTMDTLRQLLTVQGGMLTYKGRGFDLLVNATGVSTFGSAARDVAWGPAPNLIEFQPLGGGLSAKVVWTVMVRVVEIPNPVQKALNIKKILSGGGASSSEGGVLLQFNCETEVTYNEDYFSSLSIRGTMEIPLTHERAGFNPFSAKAPKTTVDDYRYQLDKRIFAGIDLTRFRVTRRSFNISRDKRTMEFDVAVEEKPYMEMPPGCTIARGTFSVRPVKTGFGLVKWSCTLRATYITAMGQPRRIAWHAFLALMRLRMDQARGRGIPDLIAAIAQNQPPAGNDLVQTKQGTVPVGSALDIGEAILKQQAKDTKPDNVMLFDFSFEEGLYLDSKSVSFSASWQLATTFSRILRASGLWTKLPEESNDKKNLWATAMQNVSGSTSWLPNKLDPEMDVVVDFGGG